MFKNLWKTQKSTNLLNDALKEISQMLEQEQHMFETTAQAFLTGQLPDIDIARADRDINLGERMVRRLVFEHLTVNPDQDLPASLSLISIVHDVERIGDYTKSLLELSQLRPEVMPAGEFADRSRQIKDLIAPLLKMTLIAFRDSNEGVAREVMKQHLVVKDQTDTLLKTALAHTPPQQDALYFSVGSRFLRRISAHLSNIASSIANPFDQVGRNE